MHLCNKLRSLNRVGRTRIQKAREITAEHRNRLDDQTLEQQNLLYELSHINKEIARCEEFQSKDQQLELVSLEDFYTNAPPELTDSSTDPVRRYIESQFDDTNNFSQSINNPSIAKLPDPLYVLYSLVLAYQQCDGTTDVNLCKSKSDPFFVVTIYIESGMECRHITCQIDSKEDSSTTNDTNSDGINTNSDQQYQFLLRPHPLHVKVTLIISPDHTGELTFSYLSQLNIVTVQGKLSGLKAQQSQTLISTFLHNLLDDNDNGQLSPNPTADFLFQQLGKSAPIFSDAIGGYPYHWVQQLCKCQMVPLQRQELVTDCSEIIKRLTQRMRARIALDRILVNLEKHEMPLLAEGNETTSILNSSLRRSITNTTILRSWREISFDDVNKYQQIQTLINENLIDRITTSIYECKFQSLSTDDNNKITLYAHIFMPANYPQARSIVLLKLLLPINGNKTNERTRANSENIKDR
ncbi:unnamed protein product [Rotaria socialis]|uniref:Uncharacterized protein n=2 Tax=Rotaria TaxID=231623 RepID=A0A821JAM2_9BILA|nr:unnamed protein product [Rotaria socialis]